MEGELQEDWEVVAQNSGSTSSHEDNHSIENDDDGDGTPGLITFDYFSLENNIDLRRVEEIDEEGSVQSGSPGWIEPRSDAFYGPKHFSELWSDSSSDRLDDELSNELGLDDSSGEIDLVSSDTERVVESPISIDPFVRSGGGGGAGEGEGKGFVWWKMPIEMLKYCVFRANPVWSFSMAAAVVGFVMLGRRLYNLKKKKKSPTLQLKVLLDDKKVVNYSARLNDAISVMKRVPIIRPALPSSVGMNQWSMMSLR
ncbi:unnamed protein product [Microthlaspi erraticum]|uniref:DUF6821 domain-containing protein n=1 Tax=Microthlaspi erraticum TaxID=1685480 RepID=A0A6D2I5J1_9BRAS|nr:unnamed protein product [Microthlaspi erraticum]